MASTKKSPTVTSRPLDVKTRPPVTPSRVLETFPNPRPGREFVVNFMTDEFTCICPMTGQPDFASITIAYTPNKLCVELKSLKMYLWSYRNEGAFHEDVTNRIMDDLVAAIAPLRISVEGDFKIRGGIQTVVQVSHDSTAKKR